jgi:DNA-directed RNA polymerase subunit beta'
VVIDWRSSRAVRICVRRIKGKDGKVMKLGTWRRCRYLLRCDASCRSSRARRSSGDILARVSLESAKTRDITGGLPRVAELFEARRPKDHAIIAEIGHDPLRPRLQEQASRHRSSPRMTDREPVEYLIPKGKQIHLQEGDVRRKGRLHRRRQSPHRTTSWRSRASRNWLAYLVNEIQEVYRLQGVLINDKHIEVIVRQMLQKVEITDRGDTDMIPGEQVDVIEFDEINAEGAEEGQEAFAKACRSCSASPRPRLQTRSFISAASFQETTRVLTEAAVNGKIDSLKASRRTSSSAV